MNVLIAGCNGQLGWELQRGVPTGVVIVGRDLPEFDIGNPKQVAQTVEHVKPSLIINAAAYTAVDKAESDTDAAFRSNRDGAGFLAEAARKANAGFLHVSTDFVFAGDTGHPYLPNDLISPLSVYGASKAAGERAVVEANPDARIVRTSWVYSSHGGNFVKTMLKLMAEKPALSVIADQVGTPTWANGLAKLLWALSSASVRAKNPGPILHYADAGTASWYDYAVAIQEEGLSLGLLKTAVPITPIRTDQYPTPAKRPAYSAMNRDSGWAVMGVAPHWRHQLRLMLQELKSNQSGVGQ